MIDTIGAIGATVAYALLVGVLIGFSNARRRIKFASIAAAVLWAAGIVGIATAGGFGPHSALPTPIIAFALLLLLNLGARLNKPRYKPPMLSLPLPALVAVNIARLGGVSFLILAARGRLPDRSLRPPVGAILRLAL
jgi:hypothetical protein